METCSVCSHQFGSRARLQRHLQCHLPPALRKCAICQAPFNQEKMVDRHMEVVHQVPKPEDPNTASQTYQIVQDGETINVILVDGAGTEDLNSMVCAEIDQIFICQVCNTEFMERDLLNEHVSGHDVPELLLCIVEQERARAAIAGAPVPKEILVSRSSERQRHESQVESDDDLDDLQYEAFMRSRPKATPTVIVKRYTSTRCRYCDKLLASEHDLQVHEKMHVNNYDFRCTACNEEFVDGEDLIKHRRMHKKRLRRSFQCAHCGIIMNDANLMKQHIDTHSGFALEEGEQIQHPWKAGKTRENKFACQICRLWFDGNRAYRKHLATHRDGKAYHCETCNRGYDRISSLKYHRKSQKAVQAHGCGLCSEKFDRSYRLTKHLMIQHDIGRFVCGHCDLRFKTDEERRAHEKKHESKDQYNCAICDDTFVTVAGLKRHVRSHQTKLPETVRKKESEPILEDGQTYWCMICQAVFTREEDLIAHGSKHFKCDACALEFADAMELECHSLDHAALERNICLNCGESLENQSLLWEHTLTHHGDSTACRCEKCHRVLLSHRHSQIHMLTHPLEEAADYHCDYFCNMCQSIFTTESFMNIHNERHKPCQICNDISDDLTLHLLQSHSLPQVEKCYHCDRVLTDPVARAEHLNTHAVSPEVLERCVDCESGFADMETLESHIKTAHSLQAVKCTVCGMLCLGKEDLNLHLRTEHLVYNIHNCNKCTNIFLNTTMDDMVEHGLTHKPRVPLTCCSCEAEFDDQDLLRLHLQTHTKIENLYCCTECGAGKAASLKELQDHNRTEHGIVQKAGGSQKVKCGICESKLKMTSIESHVGRHLKKGRIFNCQICEFGFSTMASLERHVLTHTDERPAVCAVCGQGFRNADRLRAHQRSHTDQRAHHCPVQDCRQQFRIRARLRDHLTQKHGYDAPYGCILCEQKFVFKSQLLEHMVEHGGGRVLNCPDCGQDFRTKDSLRMHRKRNHPTRTNQCPCCLTHLPDLSLHVCPAVADPVTMATVTMETVTMETVAMETGPVAMAADPVAIAMGEISSSQDTDGYVYIALDEGRETSCPICMMNFQSQESLSNHMILHQDVLST